MSERSSTFASWDPQHYLRYADHRGRPFADLIARIPAQRPRRVLDLGCGPGTLTALLAERWPHAEVTGVDSSRQMIGAAAQVPGPTFVVGDLRTWTAPDPVEVLVTNAALQWVPGHLDLLSRLVAQVRPGGRLAIQVPGNHHEPSHTVRRELAAEEPYAEHTAGVAEPHSHDSLTYLRTLTALGCTVDAWETTYLHVLGGPDPVFHWVTGTGARPTLQALPDHLRPRFEAELKRRLARAYPDGPAGVVLPFRRVFAVAQLAALD